MATQPQAVKKWEDVPPAAATNRTWEDVPANDSRSWEDVPPAGGAAPAASVAPAEPAKPVALPTAELPAPIVTTTPAGKPVAGTGLLTPAEHAEDEARNRTPENQAELERGIRAAPTTQARETLERERDRIQLPAAPVSQSNPKRDTNGTQPGQRATLRLPTRPTAVLSPKKPAPEQSNLPGFIFKDFLPGAVESTFGNLYNFGVDALTALPAMAAAGVEGLDPNMAGTDFIDRFKSRHAAATDLLGSPMQTYTGQRASELQGELVDFALDKVGAAVASTLGPVTGALTKGTLAAILAGAGLRLGKGTGLKAPIQRMNEPTFDPLSDAPGGPTEPKLSRLPNVSDREPQLGRTIEIIGGANEPKLGNVPQIPIPTREKPRIRLTPEQVTGRTYEAPPDVSTPLGSDPAPTPTVGAQTARTADPQLDAPAPAGLFAAPAAPKAPESTQPTTGPLPSPPRATSKGAEAAPADPGFKVPDTDTEYTAVRNIASDVRKGGTAGGEQYVKLPQNVFWRGETGKIDAALFDAGKQFREEGTKAAAFDRLQTLMRYFLLEDKSIPANFKDPYRQFLTDDGKQISRDRLMRGAQAYNVQLSSSLNKARRANEGQGVAIEAPAWRGDQGPPPPVGNSGSPAPDVPKTGAKLQKNVSGTPELPPAPVIERPPEVKAALAEAEARYKERRKLIESEPQYKGEEDRRPAKLKALGMKYAAEKRQITGELTKREFEAKEKFERSNYKGKRVTADGQGGEVVGTPFGKVKVKLDDGTVKTFEREQISDPPGAVKAKPAANTDEGINYNKDTLLTAIAKLGGIAQSEMVDILGESVKAGRVSNAAKAAFKKAGMGIDKMFEALTEKGFISPEAGGDINWLKNAIRDEHDLGKSVYSMFADEDVVFRKLQEEYGPGTLGANPMFNPQLWKKTLASASKVAGTVSKPMRAWFDAAQTIPDTAVPALATSWEYARKVAAAKQQAEIDLYRKTDAQTLARDYRTSVNEAIALDPKFMTRPGIKVPSTPREAIQQTELARRHVAKLELQRDMVSTGYASPVAIQGYSQSSLNLADMKSASGKPLYIRNDAKAIIDQMVGAHDVAQAAYRNEGLLGALEGINQGTVGLIMYNPGFHAVTVAGRAAPFIFNKLGTNSIIARFPEAFAKVQDRDFMYDLMKNKGYQPMRIRDSQNALGGQMGTVEKLFRKTGMDKPYDWWRMVHNKVMVDTVNKIQMSFYLMKVDDLVKAGSPRDAAELAAARMSNLIGGNLPKEEMNQLWHQILGSTMFSRSYTSTVVRQATRAITEDKILMAELAKRGHTPATVRKAVEQYRGELGKALLLDYAVMQVTGNVLNYALTDGVEDRYGNNKRHFSWDNKPKDKPMGSKPDAMDYAFPDRIYVGKGKDGKDVYMENPLRTTRDQMLFFTQGKELAAGEKPKWLSRKLGTLSGVAEDAILGQDRGGRPMRDPLDVAANVASRMTPLDFKTPAEAIRMSSFDYFADSLKSALSDPGIIALKVVGLQPHEESGDPTAGASRRVTVEQNKVWAEAGEIKRNWPNLSEPAREAALKRLREIGERAGMKEHQLERYVSESESTKGQRKRVIKGEKVFE